MRSNQLSYPANISVCGCKGRHYFFSHQIISNFFLHQYIQKVYSDIKLHLIYKCI